MREGHDLRARQDSLAAANRPQRGLLSNIKCARTRRYDELASGQLVGEYDQSANRIQELVWMNDIPVATIRTDQGGTTVGMFYVHTDHLNAPTKITRPTSNEVIWRWDHDPYGNGTPNQDPDGNGLSLAFNLRFPGQYADAESGTYYNYLRDYDPLTGRYVESDPIGMFGGINTYGYVGADPLNGIDPYGLFKVYGNWCGPDWTGDIRKSWNAMSSIEKQRTRPPIDQLDGACKDHDLCYGKCGTDYPCDPVARGQCFRICDSTLTKASYKVGGFWGNIVGAAIDRPGKRDPGPNSNTCCSSNTKK